MKKISSRTLSHHQKSDSANFDRESLTSKSFQIRNLDLSSLSLNLLTSNNVNGLDLGTGSLNRSQIKGQGSGSNYENQYFKLSREVRDLYLEMKNQVLEQDPNCALILRKSVPLDQDETLMNRDPTTIIHNIKKIYSKIFEFKKEAEAELISKKQAECNDYEGMLQKLEAEVRQHIRIEQQLKLYAESTQAKLDDIEKNYDLAKFDAIEREYKILQGEYEIMLDKLKRHEAEIEHYRKDIQNKNIYIKDLEQQIDNFPFLKNKLKEMEKLINYNPTRSSHSNVLKSSNKTNKDNENIDKITNHSNHHPVVNSKSRKASQQIVNYYPPDILKQKFNDKDKENIETYKLDLSKFMYENFKGSRNHYGDSNDTSIKKSFSKKEEKVDDFSTTFEKMKKSVRSGHSRNGSKNNKSFDQSLYSEEIMIDDIKSFEKSKNKIGMTDLIKSNYEKRMSSGSFNQELSRKSWDKTDANFKSIQNRTQSKDKEGLGVEYPKKYSILKGSKPGLANENAYIEYYKHKKESEFYDLGKLKVSSPRKFLQDRSHSVDAKQRLLRRPKAKEELFVTEKQSKEQVRPSNISSNMFYNSYTISKK